MFCHTLSFCVDFSQPPEQRERLEFLINEKYSSSWTSIIMIFLPFVRKICLFSNFSVEKVSWYHRVGDAAAEEHVNTIRVVLASRTVEFLYFLLSIGLTHGQRSSLRPGLDRREKGAKEIERKKNSPGDIWVILKLTNVRNVAYITMCHPGVANNHRNRRGLPNIV